MRSAPILVDNPYPWARAWRIRSGWGFPWGRLWAEFEVDGIAATVIAPRRLPGSFYHDQLIGVSCPWPRPEWWESTMMMAREGK
jgi:hypothetical protein